jgi:beta-lactamase regulating signal transducer with metallopeptidase domain
MVIWLALVMCLSIVLFAVLACFIRRIHGKTNNEYSNSSSENIVEHIDNNTMILDNNSATQSYTGLFVFLTIFIVVLLTTGALALVDSIHL